MNHETILNVKINIVNTTASFRDDCMKSH